MADDEGASSSTVSANPEDKDLELSDKKLVEYVKNSLAEVKADTARMKAELENMKKLKQTLLDDQNRALKTAGLPVFSDGMNLLPSLKKADSKADEIIRKLTEQIAKKGRLDGAYTKHCEKAKQAAEEKLKRGYDEYTTMAAEDLVEVNAQMEKNIQETVARTVSVKAKLAQNIKEYDETYNAVMKDCIALSQVEQDAIEQLKQLQLKKALGDETPD